MPPTDPRSQAALDAAVQKIRTTVVSVAGHVCDSLVAGAQSSARISDRDGLNAALVDLRRHAAAFHRTFEQVLREKITQELSPADDSSKKLSSATWQTLSLVGDEEVEERLYADRIGQAIAHACDAEIRELAPYLGSLLRTARADLERNPLRAEMLGTALYRAIEAVSRDAAAKKILAREFGQCMAKAMAHCYEDIARDLQARGIRPAVLVARSVEGPGFGGNSGYATLHSTRSQDADLDSAATLSESGHGSVFAHRSSRAGTGHPGMSTLGGMTARTGPGLRPGGGVEVGGPGQADAQLMSLLRRLTSSVGHSGERDAGGSGRASSRSSARGGISGAWGREGSSFDRTASSFGAASLSGALGLPESGHGGGVSGSMSVNLIRAHRAELLQASNGQLDHMVIDVVGSLFDQILSDSRVPPQLARQIARLQLPVLRVALSDSSFFSSRRHPVRRFVNRIASLACAFDDFDDGPGLQFIHRVQELVQEIVDGDFDQIELYAAKLGELEGFIAEQAGLDANRSGTAGTLAKKEAELRLQQRYMLQLQTALAPLPLPPYLRDFLPQVWSQALVLAASRDGPDSERSQRFRRAGRDLVMSVQPKGSPAMRKKFLMQLPPLMKDLNEGLKLVGWPDAAQRDFYARLLPAHAESLKSPPLSELDHNMLVKQLETIFNIAVPGIDSLSASDEVLESSEVRLEQRFTPAEAREVGLLEDHAVDWTGVVDIDLAGDSGSTAGPATEPAAITGPLTDPSPLLDVAASAIDIPLDLATGNTPTDAPEPSRGPGLMEHIQLGFAYQMHLKDEWQKVRLTHVSAGRSFFVFSRGRKHQETISMTSRMLARMCETGRMRAVESAYLMERATQRARKQLAALGAPTRA